MSAILDQNPNIHAEGNSAVCQLMWDTYVSCFKNCQEQLRANYHDDMHQVIISSIPQIYYHKINKPIIIDKCRSWTIPANIDLIKKYITNDYKMIILYRPILDIVKSFAKLYEKIT